MQPKASTTRTTNLSQLANEHFDVLVIGGGVTGAGVALDAAARGYRVALVEKNDFASGTSSKATKLVHGGIRYLPNFDFALVHEALVERGLLLQNAPFLVHPLAFVLPLYKGDLHPVGMPFTTPGGIGLNFFLDAGLWLYDLMAGRRNISKHRRITREAVLKLAPSLLQTNLKNGFIYYDAQTNDARLTIALIRTAANIGAVIANYTEVTGFLFEKGKISGALVQDRLGEGNIAIRARHVVNATGVFAEQVEALTGQPLQVKIQPSKGVHLVLDRKDVKLGDSAIVLPETEDKRILFIVPWEARAIVGTTDTGTGDLDHPLASHEDVTYLLKHLNRYLSIRLSEEDIVSTYAGYRPLVLPRKVGQSTARLSRTHMVLQNPTGLVSVLGGKLTTYRRMAQDTVDILNKRDKTAPQHPTRNLPLLGSADWSTTQRDLDARGATLGLPPQTIAHLGRSYGTEARKLLELVENASVLGTPLINELPYIQAEIPYACRYEMAMTPHDLLARRTSITLQDRQRGLGIVDSVAAIMAEEHNWSPDQQKAMAQAYRSSMEKQVAAEKTV